MDRILADLAKGLLDLLLLSLLEREGPRHGAALAHALRDLGAEVPQRSVYTALARLEEAGLVETHEEGGRNIHDLTDAGGERLATYRDAPEGLRDLILHALGTTAQDGSAPAALGRVAQVRVEHDVLRNTYRIELEGVHPEALDDDSLVARILRLTRSAVFASSGP